MLLSRFSLDFSCGDAVFIKFFAVLWCSDPPSHVPLLALFLKQWLVIEPIIKGATMTVNLFREETRVQVFLLSPR